MVIRYHGQTHGTPHALLHRRLHRPRRIQPQNRLRHAGRHPGRRGRRSRRLLGLARPRRRARSTIAASPTPSSRVPVVAAVIVGLVWLLHRWRERRRRRKLAALQPTPGAADSASTSAAHRALGLALSHRLHRRPQPHRCSTGPTTTACARSSRSIRAGMRAASCSSPSRCCGRFSSWLWSCPGCLDLADREIGARRTKFRGRGWAIFALAGMAALWTWRWTEHAQAVGLLDNTQVATAPVTRMAVEPYPINPFRWHAILETPGFYQTAEVNTCRARDRQRRPDRRALQARRHPRRRSRQAHLPGPGLSRLGHVGRGARSRPAAGCRH